MPAVSIITPCHDSEAFISATIACVLHQTFDDWELVVVDDGSTDGSAEVVARLVASLPLVRLVRQPNRGVANARNSGFRACSTDSKYLLFLDADDCLEPPMIETLVRHLEEHPQSSMAFCDFFLIDEHGQVIPGEKDPPGPGKRYVPRLFGVRRLSRSEPNTPLAAIFALAVIIPSITLIRRDAFERAGGWDESFGHLCEDTDLFLRLVLQGDAHFVPERLVAHRRHAHNSTGDACRMNAQMNKLYAKWLSNSQLTPEQRDLIRHAWWFVNGRLIPMAGALAGARHFKRGDFRGATRFWAGAARRYTLSFFGWYPSVPRDDV